MSTQQITPDKSILPLAGKYDRRKNNGATGPNSGTFSANGEVGRKPKSRKNLAGAKSNRYLNQCEKLKSPVEMFKDAIDARNYALAWSIRADLRAEAVGKPYVAINPDAVERHDQADISRIAVAINNLQIVNNAGSKGKPVIQAVTEPAMIPSEAVSPEAQVALESTNGGECGILPRESSEPIEAGAKAGTLP